ncbi:MAG: RsmE family RNA methyltransferase, partial [bacterium]
MSADRPRLFYTDSSLIGDGAARVVGDEAAHLARALRMRPGDRCRIATERGEEYLAELRTVSAKETEAEILERLAPRPAPPLSIALGLPLIKGDRFEWVLEKGTELGVDRFFPLTLSRCEVHIPENKTAARAERWRRIVRESAKQCDRVPPPEAGAPAPLDQFLRETENFDLKLVAW